MTTNLTVSAGDRINRDVWNATSWPSAVRDTSMSTTSPPAVIECCNATSVSAGKSPSPPLWGITSVRPVRNGFVGEAGTAPDGTALVATLQAATHSSDATANAAGAQRRATVDRPLHEFTADMNTDYGSSSKPRSEVRWALPRRHGRGPAHLATGARVTPRMGRCQRTADMVCQGTRRIED